MADEVGICNVALGWLGAKPIVALSDATRPAELCRANFAFIRDAVLEARAWSFAVKRYVLAPSTTAPAFGFSTAYPLNSLSLRVLEAFASTPLDLDFVVEDRAVLCDQGGGIYVRTIDRVEDPTRWSPTFCLALAHKLTAVLAIPLTENRGMHGDHEQLYMNALRDAAAYDGKQGRAEVTLPPSKLTRARY